MRLPRHFKIPEAPPRGVVFSQQCDDACFPRWLQFLMGESGVVVPVDCLFPKNLTVADEPFMQPITHAFNALTFADLATGFLDLDDIDLISCKKEHRCGKLIANGKSRPWATVDDLVAQMPMEKRSFERHCTRLYGHSPGYILRVLRCITQTAELMRRKAEQETNSSLKGSPLNALDGDYRGTLGNVFGLNFTTLKKKAEEEHWFAVLWRQLNNFTCP